VRDVAGPIRKADVIPKGKSALSKIGIAFLVLALVLAIAVVAAAHGDLSRCPSGEHRVKLGYFVKTGKKTRTVWHYECF
jgi:uncharacterized membrane protein